MNVPQKDAARVDGWMTRKKFAETHTFLEGVRVVGATATVSAVIVDEKMWREETGRGYLEVDGRR